MAGTFQVLSIFEKVVGGGVAPPMQEVDCVIMMGDWWACPSVLSMLCCNSASGGQSNFLASLSNRMVLLWVCPGPIFP